MLLALLAFLVVAGTIVGGYFAVTSLPEMMASRRMSQRLADVMNRLSVNSLTDTEKMITGGN